MVSAATAIRDYSDLISLFILRKTPLAVIIGITTVMISYAVKQGIENLGRLAFILLVPSIFLFFLGIISSIQKPEVDFILPIMQFGFGRVALGSIIQFSYFGFMLGASFLLHLTHNKGFKRSVAIPFAGAVVFALLVTIFLFIKFQETKIEHFVFNLFMLYRQTNSIKLNNLDALFVFFWTFTFLITGALFYYIALVCIARLTNSGTHQPYILPVGVIITSLSLVMFKNRADFSQFAKDLFPYLGILVTFGIPLLLFILSYFRRSDEA